MQNQTDRGGETISVPCACKVYSGMQCPNGGEANCAYSHKRICNYSLFCRLRGDEAHMKAFYHPRDFCNKGLHCTDTNPNHWISFAHPCFFRNCVRPTVACLNGWLCGYHFSCITTSKQIDRSVETGGGAPAAAASTSVGSLYSDAIKRNA